MIALKLLPLAVGRENIAQTLPFSSSIALGRRKTHHESNGCAVRKPSPALMQPSPGSLPPSINMPFFQARHAASQGQAQGACGERRGVSFTSSSDVRRTVSATPVVKPARHATDTTANDNRKTPPFACGVSKEQDAWLSNLAFYSDHHATQARKCAFCCVPVRGLVRAGKEDGPRPIPTRFL